MSPLEMSQRPSRARRSLPDHPDALMPARVRCIVNEFIIKHTFSATQCEGNRQISSRRSGKANAATAASLNPVNGGSRPFCRGLPGFRNVVPRAR